MSRSYKKTPRAGDTKSKYSKRYANRQLRRKKLNTDFQYSSYKKSFESYNICDFEEVATSFNDYWNSILRRWYDWEYKYESFPDKDRAYKEWFKDYKRK
jgi:hypothetical protein